MGLARKLHKSVARRNSGVTTSSVNVEPTAVSLAYVTRMKRECSNTFIGPSVKQNNIKNYLRTYRKLNDSVAMPLHPPSSSIGFRTAEKLKQ